MDLREIERTSIERFIRASAAEGYLSGRVLDYGCGKQPYRSIVEAAGGEYVGFDRTDFPASTATESSGYALGTNGMWDFDVILCTQVVQYLPLPAEKFNDFNLALVQSQDIDGVTHVTKRGHLVLTYPTNWPEVEPEDLHRFTKAGMERLLTEAGFTILRHERRAIVRAVVTNEALHHGLEAGVMPDQFALGYGVVAKA